VDDSNRSDIKKIYLLTDHNRLINCIEEKTEYSGFNIFKSNDYMHYAAEFDLNCLVPEKTSYNLYKEKGLFGAKYAEITLYFREEREDSLAQIITSEATAEPAYQVILAHAQEYGAKPEEEPKKSSKKEAASAGGGKEAEMKQIREMHEAGLITKEEMMELMKSLLNK